MASNTQLIPGADHSIPVEKAKEMTKLFRTEKENILIPELREKDILSICETFNRESFDRILRQPACVGLRLYFGMTPEKKIRVIAVGVNAENKDLLPDSTGAAARDTNPPPPPTEEGSPCPLFVQIRLYKDRIQISLIMTYSISLIFSFSIAIAAVIGIIRFSKIHPIYFPFIYCIWLGLLNEIIGYISIKNGFSNAINNNIYVLAESLLIVWQFKKWRLFERLQKFFVLLLIILVVFWITEVFWLLRLHLNTSWFRMFYSFTIVLMSLHMLNEQLVRERKNIMKNPIFLICTGFVIYYTYKVFVGIFWLYAMDASRQLTLNLVIIMIYINFLANLIYALAVLWMPTKERFSLPLS